MSGNPGTSAQTLNVTGGTNNQSQTSPYGPAVPYLNNLLGAAGGTIQGTNWGQTNSLENNAYNQAQKNLGQLPNFGPAAAGEASNFLRSGGDPTGILHKESNQIGFGDPRSAPGMQDVLKTIQNDVSNQVNGQFAGAGRSLSGLNEQTLARGLSQGEAVPLLNQYNQDISNQLGIQGAAVGNIGQGFNYANMAPGLATQIPMMQNSIDVQRRMQPAQLLGAYENLINPIAGLGGTSQGSQQSNQQGQGTATNSLLSQLGQIGGLLGPFGNLAGTIL